MDSKSFAQVEKSDTPAEVMNKFRNITNTLITEMGAINGATGKVEKNFWGDIMALLEKFLEKRTKAYEDLRMTSLIESSKEGIFSPSTDYHITVEDLHFWMKVAIENGEKYTIGRRLSEFMWDKIPMTQDLVEQYNVCSKNVEQHLGKSTKFLLPAQLGPDQPMTTALVDVNQFLTSLQLMKQWDLGSPKFWELIKKQKLDEKIFCSTFSGLGAPTPQTNATIITELKRKIGSDTSSF